MTHLIVKANITKRLAATLIDYAIFIGLVYLYIMYVGHDNDEGGKTVSGLLALPVPIAWCVYFIVIESVFDATLGHQLFYLKVLCADRNEIDFVQVIKRRLLDCIDFSFFGIPAIITIKNSDKHQRIGDIWAKTIVVDTKDMLQYINK